MAKNIRFADSVSSINDEFNDWRLEFIEYLNFTTKMNHYEFFHKMMPMIRYIKSKSGVAWTTEDKEIYLNVPQSDIETVNEKWEFIYYHECLHQLFETFAIEHDIEEKDGDCKHIVLNVASDCIINDHLKNFYELDYPNGKLISPEYLERKYGVVYESDKDTQIDMYYKLLPHYKELVSDPLVQEAIDNKPNIDKKIKQKDGGSSSRQVVKRTPTTTDWKRGKKNGRILANEILKKEFDKYGTELTKEQILDVYNAAIPKIKEMLGKSKELKESYWHNVLSLILEGENDGNDKILPEHVKYEDGWDYGVNSILKEIGEQIKSIMNSDDDNDDDDDKGIDNDNDNENNDDDDDNIIEVTEPDNDPTEPEAYLPDIMDGDGDALNGGGNGSDSDRDSDKDSDKDSGKDDVDQKKKGYNKGYDDAKKGKKSTHGSEANTGSQEGDEDYEEGYDKGYEDAKRENAGDEGYKKGYDDAKKGKPSKPYDNNVDPKYKGDFADGYNQGYEDAKKGIGDGTKPKDGKNDDGSSIKQKGADYSNNVKTYKNPSKDDKHKGKYTKGHGSGGGNMKIDRIANLLGDMTTEDAIRIIKRYSQIGDKNLKAFQAKCKKAKDKAKGRDIVVETKGETSISWAKKFDAVIRNTVRTKVMRKRVEWQQTYSRFKRGAKPIAAGDVIQQGRMPKKNKLNVSIAYYVDKSGSMSPRDGSNSRLKNIFKFIGNIDRYIRTTYATKDVVENVSFDVFAFDDGYKKLNVSYNDVVTNVPVADYGTMPFSDLLKIIKKETFDTMINVIITDLETNINASLVSEFIEEVPGVLVIITNNMENANRLKRITSTTETLNGSSKFVIIKADDEFGIDANDFTV